MILKLKLFCIAVLSIFSFNDTLLSTEKTDRKEDLILLRNDKVQLGVLKNAGGRIVLYKLNNGENVLKSDRSLWDHKIEKPLIESTEMSIIPYNGHITWVGPQSKWWTQQNKNIDLRNRKSKWPPDPFLIYSDCEVIEESDSHAVLKNPDSPFSRISVMKNFQLMKNGDVEITSEITNISDEPVAWDIWFNTRLDGESRFFVPISRSNDYRMEYYPEDYNVIKEEIIENYFTFNFDGRKKINKIYSSKAFIYPSSDRLYAFTGENLFTIRFNMYGKEELHPEQSLVEVYNRFKPNDDNLLELEHHTKYVELQPGEKFRAGITWSLQQYNGNGEIADQIEFLKLFCD